AAHEVLVADVAVAHLVPIDLALLYQDARAALDHIAEAVRAESDEREQPVERDQGEACDQRSEEGGRSGDRPADHRAENDPQDHIERRALAEEAFLADTHHGQRGKIDERGPEQHLPPREAIRAQAENIFKCLHSVTVSLSDPAWENGSSRRRKALEERA